MDDLLDLDWEKNTSQSSSAKNASSAGGPTSTYNFEALTRSMPSRSTPNSNSRTPPNVSINGNKAVPHVTDKNNNDAFSSLLAFGSSESGTKSNTSSMTMAERLQKEKAPQSFTGTQNTSKVDAWEGLDDFLKPSSTNVSRQSSNQGENNNSSWNAPSSTAQKPTSTWSNTSLKPEKTQHLGNPSGQTHTQVHKDPFDFSEFEDPGALQSSALDGNTPLRSSKAESSSYKFDAFDAPVPDYEESHDDILGSLGRPAVPPSQTISKDKDVQSPTELHKASRNSSPPPHVVGQLVEMGFAPSAAREALQRTTTGQDVETALESLMKQGGRKEHNDREEQDRRMALRLQKEEDTEYVPSRSGSAASRRTNNASQSRPETPADWQKQADQLYIQASEIGTNVFNRANAFWSSAKAQAQKALDEHSGRASPATDSGRASPASASDRPHSRRWAVPARDGARKEWQGKPKWMIDAEMDSEQHSAATNKIENRFKDDNDSEVPEAHRPSARATAQEEISSKSQRADKERKGQEIVQDYRTGPAAPLTSHRTTTGTVSPHPPKAVATSSVAHQQKGDQLQKRKRVLVQDNPAAVQSAEQHRQRGNELFKRGAYGEAEAAYTAGLDVLQANAKSLRRIVLLNNRANTRLKNGDARAALQDTMEVLTLIVVKENERSSPFLLYRPSLESPLPVPEYAQINLREGYAKALFRRAQAEELLERWDTAQSVWALLEKYEKEEGSGSSGVSNMRAAQDGRQRCNKMVKGADVLPRETARSRGVRASATKAVAQAEAKARERIREENAAQEAEEHAKDQLRDSVDSRILSWKTGKESNVRALLASLHDVVWPGLGWKRVGMHELVMENQVKKTYMRAIGRLHPDKLTPKNNTLEERLIGGAVFTVLNEAWAVTQKA